MITEQKYLKHNKNTHVKYTIYIKCYNKIYLSKLDN